MRRVSMTIVIILALLLTACGSDDGADGATSPIPIGDSGGAVDGGDASADAGPDAEAWAQGVADALLAYHDANLDDTSRPAGDAGPATRILEEAGRAEATLTELRNALSEPDFGPTVADGYDALVVAIDAQLSAVAAVRDRVDGSEDAVDAEIEATPEASATPLLMGTSLEPLMTQWLRPDENRFDEACFALAEALAAQVEVVLDCVGAAALTPDGTEVIDEPQLIETEGITLAVDPGGAALVLTGTNGVQLDAEPGRCLWVGRPAGVADPFGAAGFEPGNPGAMIPLPADLGPWLEDHPALGAIDSGTNDVAGLTDVPYWDVVIPDANLFFVFVDSDHPGGCDQIGFEDRLRLHLIPHPNGDVLAIALVRDSVPVDAVAGEFEVLDEVLRTITIER